MICRAKVVTVVALLTIAAVGGVRAAMVAKDVLAGYGSFERCVKTLVMRYGSGGKYDSGNLLPGPGNRIAVGWLGEVSQNTDAVYDLTERHASSGRFSQFFGLGKCPSGYGAVYLKSPVEVGEQIRGEKRTGRINEIRGGDRVTFTLDRFVSECTDDLRPSVRYEMYMDCSTGAKSAIVALKDSDSPQSVSFAVPREATNIRVMLRVVSSAAIAGKPVGAYVDGAHLYIERDGKTVTEQVPVKRTQAVRTVGISDDSSNPAELASRFDHVIMNFEAYRLCPRLKHFNPGIKTYLYQAGGSVYKADSEPVFSSEPIPYKWMSDHGLVDKWLLHENGELIIDKEATGISYVDVGNPDYQALWTRRVIDMAKAAGFDGVFIDTVGVVIRDKKTLITADSVRSFLSYVVPQLRAAGLEVFHNWCNNDLTQAYPEQYLLKPGTSDARPDAVFEEWAFTYVRENDHKTHYHSYKTWLHDLESMSLARDWGLTLHMQIRGTDDNAEGEDGYIQYGYASYLLGMNENTVLGLSRTGEKHLRWDELFTLRIGLPSGRYYKVRAESDDSKLHARKFVAGDGGPGGLVVVNPGDRTEKLVIPRNYVDRHGKVFTKGQEVTIPGHAGRIWLIPSE